MAPVQLGQRWPQVLLLELLLPRSEPCLVTGAARVFERAVIDLAERAAARRVELGSLQAPRSRECELVGSFAPVMEREVAATERVVDERIADLAEVVPRGGDGVHPLLHAFALAADIVQRH